MKSMKNYLLRGATLLMMLSATLPAMAQTANNAYIFYNATYGYLINNGGNPGVSTTFNKNAIWVANNTMGGTSRNVHSYTDDSKYFTGSNGSALTNGTFSLGTSNNQWRINNNYLNRAGNTRGYVRYNGSGFIVNQSDASQNFTGLAITINSSTLSNPTISITAAAGLSGGGIQLTGNVTGTYTPAYYYASVRNYNNATTPTYYWTTTTDATTTQPASITSWGDATRTWTVTTGGAYASVSSDGLVTITGNPTGNIVVTLTVSKGGYEGTQTITLTRAAIAQNVTTETVISGPSISPSSAALYYNEGSQAFTSSASATATTYNTPAHTTLTGGGNTYYYYNGTLYTSTEGFTTMEETHPAVTLTWALSGAAASYLTRTPATGTSTTVTHSTQSPSDQTATLTVTASATGASNKTATATITAYGPMATPTITRSGNTISLATTSLGATIYYTTDGSTPTASSTPYTGAFDLTTSPTTVKAIAIRDGHGSPVATETFQIQLAAPTITVSNSGLATITAEAGATIHYTTDGTTPTASSPTYSAPVQLTNPQIIKAIAVKTNYITSEAAMGDYITTGVSGTMVILKDLEDHTWTYYSAKPDDDYPDALHSPDPRNVKITYYANGYRHDGNDFTTVTGVQLSHNETANTFVYYETLEKTPGGQILTGNYPYKVIPNPFSKRPKNGNTYYGFEGWRIKSGGEYIDGHSNGQTLNLEEVIHFIGLDAGYTPNVISAEIELEAIWAPATVVTNSTANLTAAYSYERNFIVCNANISISNLAQNATISSRYPDGTAYGDANTTVTGITVNNTSGDIKVEHIKVSGNFYGANNKWLIVGRGCEGEISQTLSQQNNVKFRLESGTHVYVHPRPNTTGIMVMGSDYDRAQGDNSRLRIVNYVTANGGGAPTANSIAEFMDITIKSGFYGFKSELESNDTYGNYGLGVGGNTDNTTYTPDPALGGSGTYYNYSGTASGSWQKTLSFYCGGTRGGGTGGIIRVMIEGGELSSLNGGGTKNQAANYGVIMHHIRMKGGWVKGAIYGTASASSSAGSTRLVLTGGEVNGWVAGACNGTRSDGDYHGELQGNCFIYVGGNAELRSHNNDGVYNNRWGLVFNVQGGTVFGAGKGIDDRVNYVGSANSTIVSVSDNAYIEQAVYGGAFHGVSKESRIYLTGSARVGNIYGGSFEPVHADNEATWRCNNTDIRMYGGNVTGGIYGGHNAKGTVYQTTSLLIDGGQVGVDAEHTGKVHGGGYGSNTSVSGNVTVTLGDSPANSGGVTVYGNVYGGSALGDVNTNSSNTTIVTLNKGTVNGNLFGGALGEGADVNGKITVNVNGGTVNGNVFGGGDAAAYSLNADFPVVNMTGGTVTNVFGGGMGNTAVVTGNPQVTLSGTALVTGNVYGGGNAAPVTGNTSVILQD